MGDPLNTKFHVLESLIVFGLLVYPSLLDKAGANDANDQDILAAALDAADQIQGAADVAASKAIIPRRGLQLALNRNNSILGLEVRKRIHQRAL